MENSKIEFLFLLVNSEFFQSRNFKIDFWKVQKFFEQIFINVNQIKAKEFIYNFFSSDLELFLQYSSVKNFLI